MKLSFHILLTLLIGMCFGASATAQRLQGEPEVAKGIGVDQRLGDYIPTEIRFSDDNNDTVTLGQYFDGKKPVLLSFNYSDCPMLCITQLNNLCTALQQIDLVPGKDFEFVSISLDPNEQSTKARETKRKFVAAYGDLDSSDGWHFLTGDLKNIEFATDCTGFRYKYIPKQKFYSHPAAFIFVSPEGQIVRYLDGLDGDLENKIKPALMEASKGKVGSLLDKALYFSGCYYFDPSTGKYSFAVMNIMRWCGLFTVVGLLVWLVPFWLRRRSRSKADVDHDANERAENVLAT